MKRDEAISRLKQHEADLKRLGVEHLYMFGSTARGEAKEQSDVDLFSITKRESSASLN
jgi:predicted nucleotidyltransferase